jgi:hypothetical protein
VRVEHDAEGLGVAPRKPCLPREGLIGAGRIGFAFCEFLAGDAPDKPGVTAELLMQSFEQAARQGTIGAPAAGQRSAVDARRHVADDARLHGARLMSALLGVCTCP